MTITFYKERTMSTWVRNSVEYREVYRVPGERSDLMWRIFFTSMKNILQQRARCEAAADGNRGANK